MSFPVEAVPDGNVFAPHHYTYALLIVMVAVFVVWDNYQDREPLETLLFTGIGLFGFLFVWPYYPVAGSVMALMGPALAIVIVLLGWSGLSVGGVWDDYPKKYRLAVIGFSLLALDDAIEHAFGIWTPFDWLWNEFLFEWIGEVVLIVAAMVIAVGVIYVVWTERAHKN